MFQLASLLSRFDRQTIIDKTGLIGLFDVNLQWTSEKGGAPTSEKPSIYTAAQETLGLKLRLKGPLDVLVVDSAQKIPVDNCPSK